MNDRLENVVAQYYGKPAEYLRLVAVALVIAAQVAFFIMNRWLDGFAHRVQIAPGTFAMAAGAMLAVTILTVAGQAMKAAIADPVESLRYE